MGFALKAGFDILVEKRRRARKDRLRFLDEKTRVYAEFGFLCSQIEDLWGKAADWEERRARLETKIHGLRARYPEDTSAEDVPEIHDLRADLDAIVASKQDIHTRNDEQIREMGRIASLINLLAPLNVRLAVAELVSLLTESDELVPEVYEQGRFEFFVAARADLGTPLDGDQNAEKT
jgi:predicted nuclease with TOPRIM domain